MLNAFLFIFCTTFAVYQSVVYHNEVGFVHWMLWAIVNGIAYLIQKSGKKN